MPDPVNDALVTVNSQVAGVPEGPAKRFDADQARAWGRYLRERVSPPAAPDASPHSATPPDPQP